MGYYINNINGALLPSIGKAQAILSLIDGAKKIPPPDRFQADLVCVVVNGPFDAAAYAYSTEEMEVFLQEKRRPTQWLIVPGAKELAK